MHPGRPGEQTNHEVAAVTWSLAQARSAAGRVRAAECGRQAIDTFRPRDVLGVVRARAPLPLALYVAARDGLVVEQDDGGFAVLRPPLVDGPDRSGNQRQRFLRTLDRRWGMAVFVSPPVLGFAIAAATVPFPAARLAGVLALVLLGPGWIALLLTGMLVYQLARLTRMGAPSTARYSRSAESLPGYHWSAMLVHQPASERADALMRAMLQRLHGLVLARARATVAGKARIDGRVTETLVVLTVGISSRATRESMARSLRTVHDHPGDESVIVLAPASRMDDVPARPTVGGGFALLYAGALALVVVVCAGVVADAEARACAESCDGRPATYDSALRWLLQRLLFSDPPALAPQTVPAVVLGWLVSVAAAMFVLVVIVAGRQEIARNREVGRDHDERLAELTRTARTLVLVVTDAELQAVKAAVRDRTGEEAVVDQTGTRTAFLLGTVGTTEILVAQAGEQGTASAAGVLGSALRLVPELRPDYVVLTGICYGLRPDEGQQLGDIVIGRRLQGVDHRKVTEAGVVHRGVNVGCSPFLLDRFQAARVTWTGARVHIGTILTSNTVVNSRQLVDELRAEFPDAIAGEMEGTGLYEATTEDIKPDWIVVKAISDWGFGKNDDAHRLATGNVAAFVVDVLATSTLPRR
jgi:nucleoside phosphorylase